MARAVAEKVFVDANVFIRHFTGDPPNQAAKAQKLFIDATEGRKRLVTSDLVIAEVVWTLESFYKFSKLEITRRVESILNTRNLLVLNRKIIALAVAEYNQKNVDFGDAHIYATMISRKYATVATFNRRHFRRFPDIRIHPELNEDLPPQS